MSDRHVIVPLLATFIDPGTKKTAKANDGNGGTVELVDRDHEWFVHVYVLSHLQFNTEVAGVEAARCSREIARAVEVAIREGHYSYAISEDSLKRVKATMRCASDSEYSEALKEKPSPRILMKSTLGATAVISNFESACYMDHYDAFEEASVKKPEPPEGWVAPWLSTAETRPEDSAEAESREHS